ncbi:WecB/TagA/CpsF family glycosyltransferase [Phenylobacterium montanum]|uniref:WecB/TagA/CpsF family glycosyltransferase n=1 Tax=Phenylobacterium montanum TaxID=2823693 RepID=A0A975IVX6_9CAUL|nr:WecB/TagA/CpsF family glycosyltransferase [Caulobacter sp. S6]QUD89298.1 WecB/TagA/CpsF family glycosyltransferase [Caulobacter sp. S6]
MDLVRPEEVLFQIARAIDERRGFWVANHNLHSLFLYRQDEEFRRFFRRADLIEVDSVPVIGWARLVGRRSRTFHRCTYLDWRSLFWNAVTEKGWRVFFVGGQPGVAERARAEILAQWPQARLQVRHGFFDAEPRSAENKALLREIELSGADIVLVGMGMPRQEKWILANAGALGGRVVLPIGGAFDYEAGEQVPCPRWLGRLGFEGLFRLCMDPQRLFVRYCVEPWWLIGPAGRDVLRLVKAGWSRLAEALDVGAELG